MPACPPCIHAVTATLYPIIYIIGYFLLFRSYAFLLEIYNSYNQHGNKRIILSNPYYYSVLLKFTILHGFNMSDAIFNNNNRYYCYQSQQQKTLSIIHTINVICQLLSILFLLFNYILCCTYQQYNNRSCIIYYFIQHHYDIILLYCIHTKNIIYFCCKLLDIR